MIDTAYKSARRSDLLSAATLCLAITACGEAAGGPADAFTVRDSAGILIAESRAPAWNEGEGWRLDAESELEIGLADGPAEYLLSRVSSALRDADGTILVANGGSGEIRFYDDRGSYLRSVGRNGEGPGEFRSIAWIQQITGDTLLAYDYLGRRVSVFAPSGEFVRSHTLDAFQYPQVLPPLSDRSLVLQRREANLDPMAGDGLRSGAEIILHTSPTGELLDTVALMPPYQLYQVTRKVTGGVSASAGPPRFAASTVTAVDHDRVVLARGDRYELRIYDPNEGLTRIVRRDIDPRPVTDELLAVADREALERATAADDSPAAREMMQQLLSRPHAETVPFFDRVMVDPEGNLWVRAYDLPGEERPPWTVFDREGRMLGSVPFPDRFLPMQIGEDFVLGVAMDELDVQRVRLYPLRKD